MTSMQITRTARDLTIMTDLFRASHNLGLNNMEQKPPYPHKINVEVSRREKHAILHH